MRNLRNATVVITGASSGIGRATAREFAQRGANLLLIARRRDALEEVARECERMGVRAIALPIDVRDESAIRQAALQAVETFGHIDVWVNNAGVGLLGGFDQVPSDVMRQLIETNLFGTMYGARAVLPYFRQQGHGVLINIGSQTSVAGIARAGAYMISKYGVRGLGEALREELVGTDIHVCTVMPGSIDTPFFQHAANYTGEKVKALRPVYPAEKVARTVVRLAMSPKAETFVGNSARVFGYMHILARPLYEQLAGRVLYKEHFENAPSEATNGAVIEPMDQGRGVSGGWKERERNRSLRSAAILGAALVPIAGVWYMAKREAKPARRHSRQLEFRRAA